MEINWDKITWEDLLAALPKLVKPENKGSYVFNVIVLDDGESVKEKFGIIIENEKTIIVNGEIDDEEAVLFHIKKGGIQTMLAMQTEGLIAAMRFMFDGSIHTTNPGGAQKWFEIVTLGGEPLRKALGEVMGEHRLSNNNQGQDHSHSRK